MDDLSELEIELLEAAAEHEAATGEGISRAALAARVGLEFPDFVRVLFSLRDSGYLVVERERVVSDANQSVLLTHKGQARVEAERLSRLRRQPPNPRFRLSDLAE